MAIFHFNTKTITRSKGQSIVAKAAYNARECYTNQNTKERHDYRYKDKPLFTEILIPLNSPKWLKELIVNPELFFSTVEKGELRKDAQLLRELTIALPCELSLQQHQDLIEVFVEENFLRIGMVAHVVIHPPSKNNGDNRNFHVHILLTMRQIGPDGFGNKERGWNNKLMLLNWRRQWAKCANRFLELYGYQDRIDHRSLKDQGINREPTIPLGPRDNFLERKGITTRRGNINREIKERNRMRWLSQQLYLQKNHLNHAGMTIETIRQIQEESEYSDFMVAGQSQSSDKQKAKPQKLTDFISNIFKQQHHEDAIKEVNNNLNDEQKYWRQQLAIINREIALNNIGRDIMFERNLKADDLLQLNHNELKEIIKYGPEHLLRLTKEMERQRSSGRER